MNYNKYIYVGMTGLSGILNIITMLLFVKQSSVDNSDFFFFSLSFSSFLVILLCSPINTGKLKYLLSFDEMNKRNIISFKMLQTKIRYFPLILLLTLIVSSIFLSISKLNIPNSLLFSAVVMSTYATSCVYFEYIRIQCQIDKEFILFPMVNFTTNLLVLLIVFFGSITVTNYLIFNAIIKVGVVCCFYRAKLTIFLQASNVNVNVNMTYHWSKFIKSIKVYSFSVLITGLSSFLPSFLLSFLGAGFLTSYQLAYRCINSPMSLLVTPYVDYVRYGLNKPCLKACEYIRHLASIFFGSSALAVLLFFSSELLGYFFLDDKDLVSLFTQSICFLSISLITGSLYILNTRIAELNFSISKMSSVGLSIHTFFLICISFSVFFSSFDAFLFSKLFVDVFLFLPVSFLFVYLSKTIKNSSGESLNE